MNWRGRFVAAIPRAVRALLGLLGARRRDLVLTQVAQPLIPVREINLGHGDTVLRVQCPNVLSSWRVDTFFTKEPETLEWLDGFAETDVFWDIGANIGLYSLYAAAARHVKVCAFEPSFSNYSLLNRNISYSELGKFIQAYCVAFSNESTLSSLFLSSTDDGAALHTFGSEKDWKGQPFVSAFAQGMIAFSIDDFLQSFSAPFPTHIKIDVDGLEPLILSGAAKTLRDERLKSVLVEVDTEDTQSNAAIIDPLRSAGLNERYRRQSDIVRRSNHSSLFNIVFERD